MFLEIEDQSIRPHRLAEGSLAPRSSWGKGWQFSAGSLPCGRKANRIRIIIEDERITVDLHEV